MEDSIRGLSELVRAAASRGARASEVLLVHEQESSVTVQRGRVSSSTQEERYTWTVRCWLDDGRVGEASGSFDEMYEGISAILSSAESAAASPFAGPVGRLPVEMAGLGIFDRRYGNLTESDRVDLVIRAERDARTSDRRILTDPFTYRDICSQRAYLNSREVKLAESATSYHLHGSLQVVSGSEKFGLVDAQEGRGFTDVGTLPMGKRLAQRASRLLKRGGKLRPEMPSVLSPRATAAIVERLAECFSAQRIADESTFLFSEEGLSDKLHLIDDGSLLGGLRTWAFDVRGVPPVPLVLLSGGRASGRYLSPEEARRVDTRPTGHCKNGTTGPTNLILRQGTRSVNAVMTERGDRAFWIDDIADFSKFDLQTGEIEALVHGVVLHGGSTEGACRNVRMVGNLQEVLQRVIHVLSNTDRVRQVDAPALMVEGLHYE